MKMDTPGLPFMDVSRSLLYRLSTPIDQIYFRMFDSSFVTDRNFHVECTRPSSLSTGIGFGVNVTEIQLNNPIHKYFPDDDPGEDDEGEDCFTMVVEDTNAASQIAPPATVSAATAPYHNIVGFITAKFSAWNFRLTIADIEIHPSYRRQGIGGTLVKFAEKVACSRYPVRHVWLEVSNVNYPAIRSYLNMGFQVAGLDISLYIATEAEGEFAIFLRKPLDI